MSTINDSGNLIPRIYSFLYLSDEEVAQDAKGTAAPVIFTDRNPILRAFKKQLKAYPAETTADNVDLANYWAQRVTASRVDEPSFSWLLDATVSQQVFAARVLYRYAAVFSS